MTRGKLVYLENGNIHISDEFNGDMYVKGGHGELLLKLLPYVQTTRDFYKTALFFNDLVFEYENFHFETRYGVEVIDLSKDYFGEWFSDYLYFIVRTPMTFIQKDGTEYKAKRGEILVFNFGKLELL